MLTHVEVRQNQAFRGENRAPPQHDLIRQIEATTGTNMDVVFDDQVLKAGFEIKEVDVADPHVSTHRGAEQRQETGSELGHDDPVQRLGQKQKEGVSCSAHRSMLLVARELSDHRNDGGIGETGPRDRLLDDFGPKQMLAGAEPAILVERPQDER